ncbi:MAG TPA: hypothetical protein VNN09_07815 [Candidatus Competibacteraceae bacterium]|nr:hypothetical protein [Candidatus Competibacteraceae bacterium]
MSTKTAFIPALILIAVLSSGGSAAAAEQAQHQHGRAQPLQLRLDGTAQWPTDEALRQGMSNIRRLLGDRLEDIHGGRLSDAHYQMLAKQIEGELQNIIHNCRLPQEADAMLHVVLAEILQGTALMAGQSGAPGRPEGAARIAQALDGYGQYFAHLGWQPLVH